ncbi:type I-E CRISPR-associated endoribonuclease Cas2e [Lacticaseibacillus pabuli]|uniref:Type I-E CRISPR-associated endoribonuclease Cas2e n=1 Tax=Lacticaseibacillus pabuli TaxID=3025672 RepID=A0ABY7WSU6_9LACO|nr:type I-E CRISPR-associated endoribonuclease Cas2e [Lacticaseibacillus sp. KACC 23028]WDF83250.1 type I-E CRISPR-associated endoribonuclease Cas2e [Lacticaseibacillus sp. KACC 23028]
MIVITLTKVPPSLRGALTLWCQEIQTGVYVGNMSARNREKLWDRITRDIGNGQATMAYNTKNELGYQFRTTRDDQEVADFDGVPLLVRLKKVETPLRPGFSDAAKMHRARISNRAKTPRHEVDNIRPFVSLDVETTGLDATSNLIISIGAVRYTSNTEISKLYSLIKINRHVPESIAKLTNISDELLMKQGEPIKPVLVRLRDFVDDDPIVGFNLVFDDEFLTAAYRRQQQEPLTNRLIDILPLVKRTNKFLENYKLATVLKKYQIVNANEHNSLADAQATMMLTLKLIENGVKVF